ncbi:MAG: hypothetical protein K0U93_15260 [Gammaproteobacteria bacterium]|nr:hypothetical protein [Gammaproteobacteria bacterium]
MDVQLQAVSSILTRTGGYLSQVATHSVQPYRGCSFGRALCGVGCYVQHSWFVTRGRRWGEFLDVKSNAAARYLSQYARERAWAERQGKRFAIFMSSSTDPFLPHERRYRISESILEAMTVCAPDLLIVQTHSHRCLDYVSLFQRLREVCEVRVHISIETDREKIASLPAHASSVAKRIDAADGLRKSGIPVVVTVSPLLPIQYPHDFFAALERVADAVVVDHYIGGDGSRAGSRTERTGLPEAIRGIEPHALRIEYRDEMVALARRYLPGRVGVGASGFAGVYE